MSFDTVEVRSSSLLVPPFSSAVWIRCAFCSVRFLIRSSILSSLLGFSAFPILAQADGCFRTSASACIRIESAGVFAVAALFSSEAAMPFNFAILLLLMCDVSAL